MPSVLGGKRNTKVFILYLLQNIQIHVTFVTLNDMIMETDYVMYLDFSECFYELLDNSLIVPVGEENGQPTYTVSAQGKHVAQQLHSSFAGRA